MSEVEIKPFSMTVDELFNWFDAELTSGMKKKLGDRFTSLADCYCHRGGVYDDAVGLRCQRYAFYTYGEFEGVDYGAAADIHQDVLNRREFGVEHEKVLTAIRSKFKEKYGRGYPRQ